MPITPDQLPGPIVVAGHACLDIIPMFNPGGVVPAPGTLTEAGPAELSSGGAVSNVGLALHRLGASVRLITNIGDDFFGTALQRLLQESGAQTRLRVRPGEVTSYSIVLSPPGVDRSFLHAPGVNHAFDPDRDVTDDDLHGAIALHFGYPPSMQRTYEDGGASLARLFDRAREQGVLTSLDLCSPDPRVVDAIDWRAWFERVLPTVSLFCPSLDELCLLTRRPDDDERALAAWALEAGAGAVCIKLGERGLYYRSGDTEIHQPCLPADFVSATGSGDCTIAGLLTALLCGHDAPHAARLAAAVGAASVESVTASAGVRPWHETLLRAGLFS